ncbi:hypothetical protein ACEPAF_5086 [Sanghuangporus sanghuang]
MGNKASKASRKLPSKPSASWAGAKTDRSVPSRLPRSPAASETKDAYIQQDATDPIQDPRFLEKLKHLGPVKVDHHMSPVFPTNTHMKHVLQSRQTSEEEAASYTPPRNRLRASELFSVLEARKTSHSPNQLQEVARQYNVDLDVLERLARFVNTPSIIEESRRKVIDEEGKERFTVLVAWEDPLRDPASSDLTRPT